MINLTADAFKPNMKLISVGILFFLASCTGRGKKPNGDWLKGTEDEKIKTIEKHFRGLDNAMVETGYRYQELYWAGKDQNWEYANYQVEKIRVAIEHALERRPLRAKSAQSFLSESIPSMKRSIASKDTSDFNSGFLVFTASCNSCHAMEKVPFFNVVPPFERLSPIRK